MMKITGRRIKHKKGFSEELNRFLKSLIEFRRDNIFIPKGVYRFKTFEEAEKWRHRMLRGKRPDLQQ
jgi:hypothetical protein